jgi:hypothetical protein
MSGAEAFGQQGSNGRPMTWMRAGRESRFD